MNRKVLVARSTLLHRSRRGRATRFGLASGGDGRAPCFAEPRSAPRKDPTTRPRVTRERTPAAWPQVGMEALAGQLAFDERFINERPPARSPRCRSVAF